VRRRLPGDARRDLVILLDLRRDLIRRVHCHRRRHNAAGTCRDLNEPSCIRVVSLEELGGSVAMTRGLIEIACCRGVVSRARMRYGHVSSELVMLLTPSLAKRDFSPPEFDDGRLGNYSGRRARKLLSHRDPDLPYWASGCLKRVFKVYVSNSEKGASPGPSAPATSNKLLDFGLLHVQFRISAVFGLSAAISRRPGAGPAVNPLVAQQKALQMLACLGQHPARRRSGAHQVGHRLMGPRSPSARRRDAAWPASTRRGDRP